MSESDWWPGPQVILSIPSFEGLGLTLTVISGLRIEFGDVYCVRWCLAVTAPFAYQSRSQGGGPEKLLLQARDDFFILCGFVNGFLGALYRLHATVRLLHH